MPDPLQDREALKVPQAPIGEYALLGDTRSAALVSRNGSVDWLCLPRFDADPVFGYLTDADHGGHFEVAIEGKVESRSYRFESAVLETRWRGPTGTATVIDAMPVNVKGFRPQLAVVRHVRCTSVGIARSTTALQSTRTGSRLRVGIARLCAAVLWRGDS